MPRDRAVKNIFSSILWHIMPVLLLGALIAGQAQASAASAQKKPEFVSYRAIYDVTLENMSEKSDLAGLSGRMAYEFTGSVCDGWTTRFRLVTHVDMKDGTSRLTDRQSFSYETDDGKTFRFSTKNYMDGDATEDSAGTAKRGKSGLEVALTKPNDAFFKLKNAYFPLMQMRDIVKAALAGRHFMKMPLFDGSSETDSAADTTVIIGNKQMPAADDREAKAMGVFAKEPFWPVTISYFDDSENKDGLPTFRTEFLLYENGITRDLFMDYGDFSVRGKLVELDILSDKTAKAACGKK